MATERRDRGDQKGPAGRHRSDEPPPIDPPRLRDELYYNFRVLILIPLMSLILIGWGVTAALDAEGGVIHRLSGVAAVVVGALFAASLRLYFKPGPLATERWRRSPGRRRIGFALRHAWSLVVIGAALFWVVGRLHA